MTDKLTCAQCGREHPHLVEWNGQWWCPGACLVRKQRAYWRDQAKPILYGSLRYGKDK